MAHGLDEEQAFYKGLGSVLAGKRALLERQLAPIGFRILPTQVRWLPGGWAAPGPSPPSPERELDARRIYVSLPNIHQSPPSTHTPTHPPPTPQQGTYFLVADFSGLLPPGSAEDDVQFCLRLTREAGVTLIPVSAFYADRATAPRTLVRFVFCKTDEKLNTACEKLRAYFGAAQPGGGGGAGGER